MLDFYVSSGIGTQVLTFPQPMLYPLSHLPGPTMSLGSLGLIDETTACPTALGLLSPLQIVTYF